MSTYRVPKCRRHFVKFNDVTIYPVLVPVVQKVDNAIRRINHYPVDSVVCFVNTYPLDSDLSGGQRYPVFEQPGPGCGPDCSVETEMAEE